MKKLIYSILVILFPLLGISQKTDSNYIKFTDPEKDTTKVSSGQMMFSGCTLKGSSVKINDSTIHVFPSGAIAGMLNLKPGINTFNFVSVSATNEKITKTIYVVFNRPKTPKVLEKFGIEYARILPANDQWLMEGDLLKVEMKAFPGCQAYFMNNIKMVELPKDQTRGIAGIYRGFYKVKPEDTLMSQKIKFKLIDKDGQTAEKESDNKVSFINQKLPMIALTKGKMPYLNYGTGSDRLGGAKISYIDTLVKLNITGKQDHLYRVELTENQQAWIPEDYVKFMPYGTLPAYSLTSSYSCFGDDKFDYVKIPLNERLPYTTHFEILPTRIILDIYGVASNTNWLTQLISLKEVKNVYHEEIEKDVYRTIIDLKHDQAWGYSVYYEGTRLVVKIKHQPEKLKLKNLTFAVDAGHGGDQTGAVGALGTKEKETNLAIAKKLKKALEAEGAKVIMTRTDDVGPTNLEKLTKLFPQNPDMLISIHGNGGGNPLKAKGTSTYYKHIVYKPLAEDIYKELITLGVDQFGLIGSFNFTLNSPTEFPNVLVETLFMSNPEDEMKLIDEKFQQQLVDKVVKGVKVFLKNCK